ncbi:ABC transporter ATP-binding protein [Propioniciclava soli]|uniref:ABC transporter ATP-binding protein n=1 Tax=Propioniciclava soli TaxID=2775081 RepID=A0ABZ3C5F4_9ACTN|nr:ABC transporter ATP-binding protein [Propioniciclava soli]
MTALPTTALTASGLTLGYGPLTVVHDADLSVGAGRVRALVGPNGSGKSTLLRAMARLHATTAGSLRLVGADADGGSDIDCAALSAREFATRLAMLTQQRPTPAGMSVREVVALGRHPHRSRFLGTDAHGPAAIERALHLTGIADLADRKVDELSGGQTQRVWLASCLAQETGVLLLDEPTNHLDLRYQSELLDLIRDLADDHGVAVGVVLHDLNQAAAVADDVTLLVDGRVVASGTPAAVLTEARLSAAYGVGIEVRPQDGVLQIRPLPKCLTRHRLEASALSA